MFWWLLLIISLAEISSRWRETSQMAHLKSVFAATQLWQYHRSVLLSASFRLPCRLPTLCKKSSLCWHYLRLSFIVFFCCFIQFCLTFGVFFCALCLLFGLLLVPLGSLLAPLGPLLAPLGPKSEKNKFGGNWGRIRGPNRISF